jgi:hypothetical protein
MSRNVSPGEEHLGRNDRFRFEEDVVGQQAALDKAAARSLTTNKVVTVAQNLEVANTYIINTHGVELVGQETIAKYKRGQLIWSKQ